MIPPTESASPLTRVLFLNDVGYQYGAGVAQARQMQSMLLLGWEVGAIAWEPGGLEIENLLTRSFDPDLWLGMKRVRHLEHQANLADRDIVTGLLGQIARFDPTVVVAGNLHAAEWPLDLLLEIKKLGYRVIAYMHDGFLFSGRCAYPGACRLYLTGCNETCPTAMEYPVLAPNLIAGQWSLRRRVFGQGSGIEVLANSYWTRDLFRCAVANYESCETVYLAADETIFKPGDRQSARVQLGLPLEKPIVLCAAVNFEESRKGSLYLQAIIQALKDSYTFAAFGHNAEQIPGLIGLGYHTKAHELAVIYQAADLFLGTATEEAFGQTVMEAQLSGLPVVAFQAGGVVEIIRGEITGKLVRTGDIAGAITAIRSILEDTSFRETSGAWARESAKNRFSLEVQAAAWKAYLEQQRTTGTGVTSPDLTYDHPTQLKSYEPYRPSWKLDRNYCTDEHASIFQLTAHLSGWQVQADTEKLYEMGFHSGDVILEIGTFGGRSAVAELRGALANERRTCPPKYYGIDNSSNSIVRTRQILADENLIDYCHLFEGTLGEFLKRWEIRPTMVFVDGDHSYEGVKADLTLLEQLLVADVAILVHDFIHADNDSGVYGVRRAAEEWASKGVA
ncbi:MAG: class I SAM-dependent methyltransferase, partial [Opitutus sp.]